MGVHSFWDIVGPTAKPVRLESLQDRRMAVDASIWIYQFLKAVRDQEGNALKNSHIVGFFRRICKLLYFGIKPVFVFDGGVPALKRSTIQQRKERRQGKRDNASITARKLLAIQLQKKEGSGAANNVSNDDENKEDSSELFKPQDEWHLPVIPGFKYDRDDQRVVSAKTFEQMVNKVDDELENIDLDSINPASAEFEELPKSTQYLILSTLRLKSRLRMGYTRDQLEQLFPDSMDFSRFQIDMVKRRNFFTQKLMGATGVHDGGASKLDDEVIKRVSGRMNKEYKLTKTENGWTLGLGDMDGSESQKAILLDDKDIDAMNYIQNRKGRQAEHLKALESKNNDLIEDNDDEDDENLEWEDVDVKPQTIQKREDYSINAAKLPKLGQQVNSVGSRSFLDRRHDQVSPMKRPFAQIIRHMEDNEDGRRDELEDDDYDDDDDYKKQLEEIELVEATQKSKNIMRKQRVEDTLKEKSNNVEPKNLEEIMDTAFQDNENDMINNNVTKNLSPVVSSQQAAPISQDEMVPLTVQQKKPVAGESKAVPLTESEQNLQHIVSKIPEFSFGGKDSFLFQDSSLSKSKDVVEDDVNEKQNEKPVQETPAWFSSSDVQQNPFSSSNFVKDQEVLNTPKSTENYQLLSGLDAQELLQKDEKDEDDIEEVIEVASEKEDQMNEMDTGSLEENGGGHRKEREALAYDYDFSEGEEEDIAENMRKEQLDFATFKNALNNRIVDNAFVEDELFEQQMKDKRDSDEVTTDMIVEVQDLLSRFGIPFITAPMEAEAQCAELLGLKLVDGIITDDSDVFLFGGSRVYKNMFHEKNYVEFYDYQSIKQNLGLDRDTMIELAQLLGSDYTNGIKGMGPVSSMEVLAEFGNLIKFRDWYNEGQFDTKKQQAENKYERDLRKRLVKNEVVLSSDFPSELVRDSYLSPEVDHDKSTFIWGAPDLDMLRQFMRARVGWTQEKSDEILVPLIRDINNRKKQARQMTLNEFFPSEYIQEKKLNFGKRLTTASSKLKKRKMK